MAVPAATYRLQLGEDLGFDRAIELLPYLGSLGIDALYLSPITASAGGGGYHVTDPTTIDPALGGERGFDRLAAAARDRGIGIVLDIVPNHMKAGEESPWWADVLRRGRGSRFASYFDVDWERHDGKIMLPVLTEPGAREEDDHTIRAYWRDAVRELNYRRFFDITDLVCLRQEDPEVFDATHTAILRLVREEKVTGLRVDHVDGLRDPQGYLERLRSEAPGRLLLVEKILASDEELPDAWPVDGTTGYEIGDAITGVLTDPTGAAACDDLFRTLTGGPAFAETARAAKDEVLRALFGGEVDRLVGRFRTVAGDPGPSDEDLRTALVAITTGLDVYRTYVRDASGPSAVDRVRIESALERARAHAPADAVRAVGRVLLDPGRRGLDAVLDWQQVSGPAMAKGLEDTALYRHTALVSRNEVGGDPGEPIPSPAAFHAAMARRAERWPRGLTTTSTHDSKRSEDVRARIAVLSEATDAWRELAASQPDATAERLLLLQTLLGAWPLDGDPDEAFVGRVQEAMVKSAREAKLQTSWLDPDEGHEQRLRGTVATLAADPGFRERLAPLQERLAIHGAAASLAQAVLRTALPGIPDLYRGCESWFLRLVDPDNRAPVDFPELAASLEELDRRSGELPALAGELRETWRDGRIKVLVTAATLRARKADPELFREGSCEPVEATGPRAGHVLAFSRRRGPAWALAIVGRGTSELSPGGWPVGAPWKDTTLGLPAEAPRAWNDAITGTALERGGPALALADVLRHLPVALLIGRGA